MPELDDIRWLSRAVRKQRPWNGFVIFESGQPARTTWMRPLFDSGPRFWLSDDPGFYARGIHES